MDARGYNRGLVYGFLFDLSSILLNKIGIKKDPWTETELCSVVAVARVLGKPGENYSGNNPPNGRDEETRLMSSFGRSICDPDGKSSLGAGVALPPDRIRLSFCFWKN